ncbi:nucleoside-diphosphate-sugar epimerase [Acidovorax sp. 69]|nr:nucleoside-diphosphate-sugar epimerase [Acidovorax sp. 69]
MVTGSQGFIAQVLIRRLLKDGLGGQSVTRLTAVDMAFEEGMVDDSRIDRVAGSIHDQAVQFAALREAPDVIFHLSSVPGGAAERNPDLGRRVNLDATLALLESCRTLARPPRFVYASSVAVYGEQLPASMDEDAPPAPALTYGAHKLACEILLADASRRGWVDGCSLRLPGVVARPGDGEGLMSSFMSQIFWRLANGEPITLPVSAGATCWWMSVGACVDNLLHTAAMDSSKWGAHRCYQLPVLHLSIEQVVVGLEAEFGRPVAGLVQYEPNPLIERLFGSSPPMRTPSAEAIGLCHDGNLSRLVRRAVTHD